MHFALLHYFLDNQHNKHVLFSFIIKSFILGFITSLAKESLDREDIKSGRRRRRSKLYGGIDVLSTFTKLRV